MMRALARADHDQVVPYFFSSSSERMRSSLMIWFYRVVRKDHNLILTGPAGALSLLYLSRVETHTS